MHSRFDSLGRTLLTVRIIVCYFTVLLIFRDNLTYEANRLPSTQVAGRGWWEAKNLGVAIRRRVNEVNDCFIASHNVSTSFSNLAFAWPPIY